MRSYARIGRKHTGGRKTYSRHQFDKCEMDSVKGLTGVISNCGIEM